MWIGDQVDATLSFHFHRQMIGAFAAQPEELYPIGGGTLSAPPQCNQSPIPKI
jgi:hypothetical protein